MIFQVSFARTNFSFSCNRHVCEIFEVSFEEIISGTLLNNSNLAGEQNKASQIERINGMLKGCSDQIVDTVADVVESINLW